ncbi:MAG: RNA polymerase sigma factor [Opitutaceae bacterium]|nr:RNA polymerase sigma factor [Opitutaceae bacterium]
MTVAVPQFRVYPCAKAVNLPPAPVDTPSDHELMIAVRAGEINRLGELFERHNRPLYGFFVRLTNQPAASEDLVQMVFYRILKYRHTYRDEGLFSAWIYHLARKVAADYFRKNSAVPAATDPAELTAQPDPAPAPADRAAKDDDLEFLRIALARLPLDQREVLVLSRLQNVEHREIARLLDCSVGAVKVRVHRALKELREVYFKLRHERHAT